MTPDPIVCDGHQELRDIVIETRKDVSYIRERMDALNDCMRDHDVRLRTIEITGSKKAEDALSGVESIDKRLNALEKGCMASEAVETAHTAWIDSIWAKAGMLVGAALGVIAFLRELVG